MALPFAVILSDSEESLRQRRNMRPVAARSVDSLRSLRMTEKRARIPLRFD